MINKKLRLFIAPALLLGLSACNNDDDDALGMRNGNGQGSENVRYDLNHVNYRGLEYEQIGPRNKVNNNARNVNYNNNDNNDFIDNRGPLTEDYSESKFNNGRTRMNTNARNRDNDDIYMNTRTRGYDINNNKNTNVRTRNNDTDNNGTFMNTRASNKNNNTDISSFNTNKSSSSYPHTRAILIQEAKYRFVPVNENDNRRYQAQQSTQFRQSIPTPANLQSQQQNLNQPQQTTQSNQQNQAQTNQQQVATGNIGQMAQQVIDLTNAQRKQRGLPALQADTKLSNVAQTKSDDMQKSGYFSHTSPTYGSPFDMMRDFGITYRTAGENIAQGQRSAQEVVNAWMNSEGHRKNILSKDFTHIGVGYDATGKHWTQMFVGR